MSLRLSKYGWFFSASVQRLVLINSFILILLFIIFNAFTISFIHTDLTINVDNRITHEMEKIAADIRVAGTMVLLVDSRELRESDFVRVTENPFFFRLYSPDGKILIQSANLSHYANIPFLLDTLVESPAFRDLFVSGRHLREKRVMIRDRDGAVKGIMQLCSYSAESDTLISDTIRLNAIVFPLVLLLIVIISAFIARKSYLPLHTIISVAENISINALDSKIEYRAKPSDIFGRLRDTLNTLLNRISKQVAQISQFTDNASHQLLNPLTAIRSEIEYSLKKERTTSEYHDTLALINQQTSKMIDIINTLLLISKTGRDESIRNSIFNLTNSLENACKDFEARKIALLQPEKTIYIKGTDQYFTIVIENLIENAAKYSTPEKDITIRVTEVSGEVVVAVEDFGIGIPPEEREAIFTRFYRSGQSERIGIKGYGLGLSLAKTIVENMGGRITLKDNIPAGSIFSMHFPRIMGE